MNSFKTRFPKNANDGDEILDINGNIYKYNAEEDTWNVLGLISLPGPVSKNSDGIVNVQLFKKLKLIEKLIDDDYDFRLFKLKYETDNPPYNFVFYSNDDLIKFSIEDNISIRMEVNYNKLYQKLLKICCKGPKGPEGDEGDKGIPGIPSYNESFKTITIVSFNEFKIDDVVNIPIDTEISVRCFSNKTQFAEININLDGSYEILEDVKIDKSKSKFTISIADKKATISGNIALLSTMDLSKVEFKARQRGRKGEKGESGRAFFVIKEQLVDDSNVSSKNAIVSIRKSNLNNNIFYFETPMHNEVCVSNLKSISSDEVFSQYTIEDINFVGVEPTTRDCKYVGHHKFELLEDQIEKYLEVNKLELPSWTPTRDCVLSHRYGQYKFDWYNKTTEKYPYKIRPNPPPPESCGCIEDFFFCPNVGDIPCAVEGEIAAPTTTRFSDCECISPIEGEIQGSGYFLGNIKSCGSTDNTLSITGCVNGVLNTVYTNAEICGECQVRIILNKDFSMFDSEQEMINGDLYQDENDVHTTIVIGSSNGFVSITDGGISELSSIEDEMIFYISSSAVDCAKDSLTINVSINDTNKNYCYGYKLTVIVNCNCAEDSGSGSEPGGSISSGSETITASSITDGVITGGSGSEDIISGFTEGQLVSGKTIIDEIYLNYDYLVSESTWIVSELNDIIQMALREMSNPDYFFDIPSFFAPVDDDVIDGMKIVFDEIIFLTEKAVKDENGPFGDGYYFIRDDFEFNIYSYVNSKKRPIRIDTWTDVIFFASEKKSNKRAYKLYARLKESIAEFGTGSTVLDKMASLEAGAVLSIDWDYTEKDLMAEFNYKKYPVLTDGKLNIAYGDNIIYYDNENFKDDLPGEFDVESIFPTGKLVYGSVSINELMLGLNFDIKNSSWISTGPDIIAIAIDDSNKPYYKSNIIDLPQNDNIINDLRITFDDILISAFNAVEDEDGPLGKGFYFARKQKFKTYVYNKYKNTPIRTDTWTNIVFYSTILSNGLRSYSLYARLISSVTEQETSSPIMDRIAVITNGGILRIEWTDNKSDLIKTYKDGLFIDFENGKLDIFYGRKIEFFTSRGFETYFAVEEIPALVPVKRYFPVSASISDNMAFNAASDADDRLFETFVIETFIGTTTISEPEFIGSITITETTTVIEPNPPRVWETLPEIIETTTIAEPHPPRVWETLPAIIETTSFAEAIIYSRILVDSISESIIHEDPDYGIARLLDSTTQEQVTTGAAIVIDKPAVATDVTLIAVILIDRGSANTVLDLPTDHTWDLLISGRFHGNRRHYYVLSRRIDGTELSTMSFGPASASQIGCIGSILSFEGIMPEIPITDAVNENSFASQTTGQFTCSDLTIPYTPMLVISLLSNNTGTVSNWRFTPFVSGDELYLDELIDFNASTEALSMSVAMGVFGQEISDYPALGYFTISTSSSYASLSMALRPSAPQVVYTGAASIAETTIVAESHPPRVWETLPEIVETTTVAEPYPPRVWETLPEIVETVTYIDQFIGPEIIAYSTNEQTTNGILEITKPNCKIGDILIASISIDMGTDVALSQYIYTNDNWTDINHSGFVITIGSRIHTHTYYKVVDGAEPATFEFGPESGIQIGSIGTIFSMRGVNPSGVVLQEGPTNSSGSSTTVSISSLTMDSDHMPWITLLYTDAKSTYSGWTNNLVEISDFAGATENLSMAIGWRKANTGATGTAAATISGSTNWHSVSIGLISSPPAVVNLISKVVEETIDFSQEEVCLDFQSYLEHEGTLHTGNLGYVAESLGSIYSTTGWDYEDWAGTSQVQTAGYPDTPDTGVGTLSESAVSCETVINLDITGLFSTANNITLYVYVTNPGGRSMSGYCKRSSGMTMIGPLPTAMNSTGWHIIDFPYDTEASDTFRVYFTASGASASPVGIHAYYVEFIGDCT